MVCDQASALEKTDVQIYYFSRRVRPKSVTRIENSENRFALKLSWLPLN
jgi:hypothetical protein